MTRGRSGPVRATRGTVRRETHRPHYVRRRIGLIAVIAFVVALGVYLPATLLAPVPTATGVAAAYTAPTQTSSPVDMPTYGGSAIEAVGYPSSLVTGGSTQPRPIASITKIVTALVVLQKKPLNGGDGPTITVTAQEHALYGEYLKQDGEVAPMDAGQKLTERQMLQVALIKSANNYAGTLALWAFGSTSAYRTAATAWLSAHHLDHTTINEPTGLDFKNRSTPSDLIALGRLALADADVSKIVSTQEITVPGVGVVDNSNDLLGHDDVVGIKTGTLNGYGANLLFATKQQVDGHTVELIGAVLGGKDHPTIDADIQKMLAQVTARFHVVDALKQGAVLGTYATGWGATATASTTGSVSRLVYGPAKVSATVRLDRVGTASAGAHVGTVTVRIGSESATVPLALDSALPAPSGWWRVTNPRATFTGAVASLQSRL